MAPLDETSYQAARALASLAALGLALALEHWRPNAPLRPAWRANLGVWAVATATLAVACGTCGWVVAEWASAQGLGLLAWAGAGPWLAGAIGLLALDAVSYAWHRANHRVPLLWRFHRVHHADPAFHATTALRFHPGELLMALPVRLAAVIALGVPPAGVLAFEVVFGIANVLEHGNFDLPSRLDRAAQRVLVTPAFHRAHHEADWRLLDTNFGTVFSFWDRLAGTFRPGEAGRAVVTGLPGGSPRAARGLAASLLLPFARGRAAGPRRLGTSQTGGGRWSGR